MTSKIKIKVGDTEIEFEGSEEYMREEIPGLVELLNEFAPAGDDPEEEESEVLPPSTDPAKTKFQMTTNTIASKIGAKSGADLILAACAHLCLVKGQDTYKRSNILAEMKLATNFNKMSFNKNLSVSLKALVKKNKLLETTEDTYALESNEKQRLETVLSGS